MKPGLVLSLVLPLCLWTISAAAGAPVTGTESGPAAPAPGLATAAGAAPGPGGEASSGSTPIPPGTATGPEPSAPSATVPGSEASAVFTPLPPPASASGVVSRLTAAAENAEAVDPLTAERARIRLVGDYEALFRGATVGDVVRALAEHAQMRYIAPASDTLTTTVSISGVYNLLDLLDLLHDYYGVAMAYERGVWRFSRSTPDALVLQTYQLHNNNREDVDITSPVINAIGAGGGYAGSGNAGAGAAGNASTSAGGGAAGAGSNASFKVSYDALTRDVEDLISLPAPLREGGNGGKAPGTAGAGKVKFIPETNELMVVASQYHQDLVREYLQHVDQPLEQIEFSAYFVETSRDPQRQLGLDWTNNGSVAVSGTSSTDLNHWLLPRATILTQYQLASVLRLTAQDSESAVVQNPSVVGLPNRKTVLDATRQIPVAQSTFNAGGSANPSTSTSLQYLDVGTIVNIFPIVRVNASGEKIIRLHVSLVVSSLLGETLISGNPAPLTARRRFEFSAEVPAGRTLAIGGLVSSTSNRVSNKVPFLSALPVAGRLFRSDSDTASRSNMIVYITPRILPPGESGTPAALPRVWPDDPHYQRPAFGHGPATPEDLRLALAGFTRELDAVQAYLDQLRDPAEIKNRLGALRTELDAMTRYVRSTPPPALAPGAAAEVESLSRRTTALQRELLLAMRL